MSGFMKHLVMGRPHPGSKSKTAAEEALERRRQSEVARGLRRQEMLGREVAEALNMMERVESSRALARIAAQRAEEDMRHATAPYTASTASESYLSSGMIAPAWAAMGPDTPSSGPIGVCHGGGVGYYSGLPHEHPVASTTLTAPTRPAPPKGRGVAAMVMNFGTMSEIPEERDIVVEVSSGRMIEVVRVEVDDVALPSLALNIVGHHINSEMFSIFPIEVCAPLRLCRPATEEEIKIAKEAA